MAGPLTKEALKNVASKPKLPASTGPVQSGTARSGGGKLGCAVVFHSLPNLRTSRARECICPSKSNGQPRYARIRRLPWIPAAGRPHHFLETDGPRRSRALSVPIRL